MKKKEETKINVLMNIDNYFGEHKGRLKPILMFLGISIAPLLGYAFFLIGIVPLRYVLILEVPFVVRVALKVLGDEDEKFRVYMAAKNDAYSNADDLIGIPNIQGDGLVEYEGSSVAYIISAFTATYFDEDKLTTDIQAFLNQLEDYVYDVHGHLVVDEFRLQDGIGAMTVYKDKELMKERMDLYVYQDESCAESCMLYRLNFVVKGARYDWKKLKAAVDAAASSSYAKVFKECYVCDREQAEDVISRDLYLYVDMAEMMKNKYANDEFYGSKVYYYGDAEKQVKQNKEMPNLEERRVIRK